MKRDNSDFLLTIAIWISMIIWGMSWASAKVLSSYGNAMSIAYIRFWLVVLTLGPILPLLKIPYKIHPKGSIFVLGSGFFMGFYSFIFFTGLQNGMAGAGGVLVTTLNPLLAFIVGIVISRKIPDKQESLGLLLGIMAGLILLQFWKQYHLIFSTSNLLFLLAASLWAIMSKITSRAKDFGHPLAYNFWMHVVTTILMSFMVDFKEIGHILTNGDTKFWSNIIYFGTINSSMATAVYLYATSAIGAEKASTYIFLVPAGAIFSTSIFLGEPVYWHTILGGTLGVLAVLIINKRIFNLSKHRS